MAPKKSLAAGIPRRIGGFRCWQSEGYAVVSG